MTARSVPVQSNYSKKSKSKCSSKNVNKVWTVTIETIEESWKQKHLAKYQASDWLSYEKQGKLAVDLKCLICMKYERH